MTPWLWISPHPGDVAFSCAAAILAARRAGVRPIVVTVFSDSADDEKAERRAEDRVALTLLGAEAIALDLLDAPTRRSRAATLRWARADAEVEAKDVDGLWAALAPVLARRPPRIVHLPLGVGNHVDHRTCEAIADRFTCPVLRYADRPWADVPGLIERRLGQEPDGLDATLRSSNLVLRETDPERRADDVAAFLGAMPRSAGLRASRVRPPPADHHAIREAWSMYATLEATRPMDLADELVWRPDTATR